MKVTAAPIAGALVFSPTVHRDDRGFFTRTFDTAAARNAGIDPNSFVQDSQSRSNLGVIRGMHLRRGAGEAKLVRCARGEIFDVLFDARPGSPTYEQSYAVRLDDRDHQGLYIPAGVAHGWQALSEVADVCYRIDAEHDPAMDVTINFADPDLGIAWPLAPSAMSARDRSAPPWIEVKDFLRAVRAGFPR